MTYITFQNVVQYFFENQQKDLPILHFQNQRKEPCVTFQIKSYNTYSTSIDFGKCNATPCIDFENVIELDFEM